MSKFVLFPVGDTVLVKLRKVENVSAGGIVLATDRQSRLEQQAESIAEVIRIGPLAWTSMDGGPWANVGDLVMIQKYAGIIHKDGDDEYRLLFPTDIRAIVVEVH